MLATLPSAVRLKTTFQALMTQSLTKATKEDISSISKRLFVLKSIYLLYNKQQSGNICRWNVFCI